MQSDNRSYLHVNMILKSQYDKQNTKKKMKKDAAVPKDQTSLASENRIVAMASGAPKPQFEKKHVKCTGSVRSKCREERALPYME